MKTFIVDSFTDEPFKGNPAGVCLLKNEIREDLMLSIAQELGLSETAFIKPLNGMGSFTIRFFSPKMEIPLCGHATLAASKVLFETSEFNEINFANIQNLHLHIKKVDQEILMEFPVYQTKQMSAPVKLLKALGLKSIVNTVYNVETNILMLEIENVETLKQLQPDFGKLYESTDEINGVLVTAKSNDSVYDFHSRYFWPWSGTNEDPVTGATHTFLTPYWSSRLDKTKMNSFQCSSRTGFMEVELISDTIITIKSNARIVFEGNLRIA